MELPPTSADRMNDFALWIGRSSTLGESACEQLEKAGFTIIDVSVLHRLLLMAGFTGEEIERAQEIGTTSALSCKLLGTPPHKQLSSPQEILDWGLKGALAYLRKPRIPSSHQPRLAFAGGGDGGAEFCERFGKQLEAQDTDPDVKE